MAAHLDIKSGGGGQDPPKKKKFKFNRKTMLIVGGVGVVLLVLVMAVMRKPTTASDMGDYSVGTPGMPPGGYPSGSDGYGSNSADIAAQMQTIQDSLTSEVQRQFNSYAGELKQQNDEFASSLATSLANQMGNVSSQYQSQFDDQMTKFSSLFAANNDAIAMLQQQMVDSQMRYNEQVYYTTGGNTSMTQALSVAEQNAITRAKYPNIDWDGVVTGTPGKIIKEPAKYSPANPNWQPKAGVDNIMALVQRVNNAAQQRQQQSSITSTANVTAVKTGVQNKAASTTAIQSIASRVATTPKPAAPKVSTPVKTTTTTKTTPPKVVAGVTVNKNVAANRAAAAALAQKMKK